MIKRTLFFSTLASGAFIYALDKHYHSLPKALLMFFFTLMLVMIPAFFIFRSTFNGLYVNIAYYMASNKYNFSYPSQKAANSIWKFIYNTLSTVHPQKDLTLLNYGYASLEEAGQGIFLDTYRKSNEVFQLQLYNFVTMMSTGLMTMQGKTFVEIGCGRGGGLSYVVQELKPEKTFGIDISESNIQFCKKTFDYSNRNIEFIVGDA